MSTTDQSTTQRSPDFPALAVGLRESEGTRDLDFHPAPRRQLVSHARRAHGDRGRRRLEA